MLAFDLKGETSEVFRERVIKEGSWKEEDDINNMWEKMATNIQKVASEVWSNQRKWRRG